MRELIQENQAGIIPTSAGISADSGVPTVHRPEGLIKDFRAEELATPDVFAQDSELM